MIRRNARTIARAVDLSTPWSFEVRLPAWYEDAVCSQTDPESFFPVKDRHVMNNIKEAKAVCGRCPVQTKCLQYAIDTDERHGIWGGLTAFERDRLAGRRWSA